MSEVESAPESRPVKDAHKTLGMWSIRRALTLAFSGAAMLMVAAWFFVLWLLGSPPHDKPKPLDTSAQLDLLKLVFALVAGVGALVALVTAYRRQRVDEAAGERAERIQAHAERVQRHSEHFSRHSQEHAERVARDAAHDATERRVTELYGQAVEQLGHDKAAVRLGGLYSLERLAQDHPEHRQTVTDVICAYLRMPFQYSSISGSTESDAEHGTQQDDAVNDVQQELQVRLTAQYILHRHLTAPTGQSTPSTYWDRMRIDLTGALLIDLDFTDCHPGQTSFRNASFSGVARFNEAVFNGDATFDRATFDSDADFTQATFSGYTGFHSVTFVGSALFFGVAFNMDTSFLAANFNGRALFGGATFNSEALLYKAQFNNYANFSEVKFDGKIGRAHV